MSGQAILIDPALSFVPKTYKLFTLSDIFEMLDKMPLLFYNTFN